MYQEKSGKPGLHEATDCQMLLVTLQDVMPKLSVNCLLLRVA
jgi:hypothetical protein